MPTDDVMEKRLRALEEEVADLKRRLDMLAPPGNWLERVVGSMDNNPAFEDAMRYGREYRQSLKVD